MVKFDIKQIEKTSEIKHRELNSVSLWTAKAITCCCCNSAIDPELHEK